MREYTVRIHYIGHTSFKTQVYAVRKYYAESMIREKYGSSRRSPRGEMQITFIYSRSVTLGPRVKCK